MVRVVMIQKVLSMQMAPIEKKKEMMYKSG